MAISNNTIKKLDLYTRKLVKKQPMWLRKLFDAKRVAFSVDEDMMLSLEVDTSLDDEVKDKIQVLVGRYVEKHPAKFIQGRNIFH